MYSGHCEEDIEKVLSEFPGIIKDHECQISNSKRESLIENALLVGCVTRIGSALEEKITYYRITGSNYFDFRYQFIERYRYGSIINGEGKSQ